MKMRRQLILFLGALIAVLACGESVAGIRNPTSFPTSTPQAPTATTTTTPVRPAPTATATPESTPTPTPGLRLAPVPTPIPSYDRVEAEASRAGVSIVVSTPYEEKLHSHLAMCGGAVAVRDALVNGLFPSSQLVSKGGAWRLTTPTGGALRVHMSLRPGIHWEVKVKAAVNFRTVAEGGLTGDCEITTKLLRELPY